MIHSMYIGICQKRHHSISNNCTYNIYILYKLLQMIEIEEDKNARRKNGCNNLTK